MSNPLLRICGRHRLWVAQASACSAINKIFDLAPPVLIGAALDVVVKREDSWLAGLGLVAEHQQLAALGVATVVIWGLESLTEYLHARAWRNLAQTVQHELRLESYAHIQRLDMGWFDNRAQGGLMAVLNDDINQLERFLDGGVNSLIQVVTTAVTVGTAFVVASLGLAVVAISSIPVILWGSVHFQTRIAPRYRAVRDQAGRLNGLLANNLAGIATIKGFTAEERELGRLTEQSEAYRRVNRRAIALSAAFSPLIRMVIAVGFTTTLVYGGMLVLDGALEVGIYTMLVFLTQRLLWPMTRLGETFDLYQRAMASTARVLELLDTPVAIRGGSRTLPRDQVEGHLEFRDLCFGYPGREPIFDGFSLSIPAGSTVGVVGATGAGKTTLIRLLLRFHDVSGGRVSIDGFDVRELGLGSLRGAMALVSQHSFLFPGSVAENIAYGRPGASQAQIEEAARLAEADAFIRALPEGYQTRVGERGVRLSGGQRQRISIARAVLCDAPILLLDEATSAVDNETEAAIQRSLTRLARGRTTLVIAHRLSTVRQADEIVVLAGGRIVERGNHEALLARGEHYARLWAVQTGVGAGGLTGAMRQS